MLRNLWNVSSPPISWSILNEVLSLNAQECVTTANTNATAALLNEVLSLNAQELKPDDIIVDYDQSSMKS